MENRKHPKRNLRPTIVFLTGDMLAVPIPLERETVILGRALEADVRVNDKKVSRRHAKIDALSDDENDNNQYVITDLHSNSGTFVNSQPIKEAKLQNGDKIQIGGHILRFDLLDDIDREYQSRIRRLLSHDDLTGLLSSRSFFSELRREAAVAKEKKHPFCVLMMDIDYFKKVNDSYGHLTGSKTLEEIGEVITGTLRTGDVAARFGGEEFAAFLLDAELAQGIVAAERIRTDIENHDFTILKSGKPFDTHQITISIGVACFPEDSSDPIELIEMADSALYRAKRSGRNCVAVYREIKPEELNKQFHSNR